jgi:hypothetical protein
MLQAYKNSKNLQFIILLQEWQINEAIHNDPTP